jgi:hypothetical protein
MNDMALAREVARVLHAAGAPLATASEPGVALHLCEDGGIEVRWSSPCGPDARYVPLFELERCAADLRGAGIRATLVMDGAEPRIVCPPRR